MKKYWAVFLLGIFVVLLGACSGGNETVPQDEVQEVGTQEEGAESNTPDHGTEGVTITVLKAVIGDYSEDMKVIQMTYEIQNDSDRDFGYNPLAWRAIQPSGWQMMVQSNLPESQVNLVPAGTSLETEVWFGLTDGDQVEQFTAEYTFLNYDEDYWNIFNDFKFGRSTYDVFEEKYGGAEILEFEVRVEK